jgi:hypothetical protein
MVGFHRFSGVDASFFRAVYGQQLQFFISNKSIRSLLVFCITFGDFMLITADLFCVKTTWFHFRLSIVPPDSACERISPSQNEPTNATQHAGQKTQLGVFFPVTFCDFMANDF